MTSSGSTQARARLATALLCGPFVMMPCLESALVRAIRSAGHRAQAWGSANWFGSAGRQPGSRH
eukprot:9340603-Prorocentrum_lima.AAC.1